MTIRSLDRFTDALWDWSCLDGCFGSSRISPTDIDGIVEVGGRFLLLEAKGAKARVTRGQARMFDALMRTGVFTIFVIYGYPGVPIRAQRWPAAAVSADLAAVRKAVSAWYRA